MASRSGVASLPLHHGHVPRWLSRRMADLGVAITEAVILAEGQRGFLRRLADPFWFQAFGAVLGMDWHSSGITTSVMGALKRGLGPCADELGIYVCGGRGKHSRRTPEELIKVADHASLDGDGLVRASRLVAKVDNVAVQDGFSLYLHAFVVTSAGDWVVVQQGMCGETRQARRYHWRSEAITSFVNEPHEAVVGPNQGRIINLTDHRASSARSASLRLARQAPDTVTREVLQASRGRHVQMPAHHDVRPTDVFLKRLHAVIVAAQRDQLRGFDELLLTRGLGPRTMQALALVAEVVHGAPSRFDDPARFAFAHGGKDGHPHPVPLKVYDQTIEALRRALSQARVGRTEKLHAFRRLESQVRQLEHQAKVDSGPALDEIIDEEWRAGPKRGGMTVFGPPGPELEKKIRGQRKKNEAQAQKRQLKLFNS